MLLECGIPMSKETGVPKDGILAHVASTFAEDRNRNNNESASNMLALNSFKIKSFLGHIFSGVLIDCEVESWQSEGI